MWLERKKRNKQTKLKINFFKKWITKIEIKIDDWEGKDMKKKTARKKEKKKERKKKERKKERYE